jgi:hypothetical protein
MWRKHESSRKLVLLRGLAFGITDRRLNRVDADITKV